MIYETLRPNLFSVIANKIIFKASDSIVTPNNNASVRISEDLYKQKQTELDSLKQIFSETFDREKIKGRREKASNPRHVPKVEESKLNLPEKTLDISHLNSSLEKKTNTKKPYKKEDIKKELNLEEETKIEEPEESSPTKRRFF